MEMIDLSKHVYRAVKRIAYVEEAALGVRDSTLEGESHHIVITDSAGKRYHITIQELVS